MRHFLLPSPTGGARTEWDKIFDVLALGMFLTFFFYISELSEGGGGEGFILQKKIQEKKIEKRKKKFTILENFYFC